MNAQEYVYLRGVRRDLRSIDLQKIGEDEIRTAAESLVLRPDEPYLSVYRIGEELVPNDIGCIYSLTHRRDPQRYDYVLVPSDLLDSFDVKPEPVTGHPMLADAHFGIYGVGGDEAMLLARRLLKRDGFRVHEIAKPDIVDWGKERIGNDEILANLILEKWGNLVFRE